MNRFVVETFQIDGVWAIDGELACIDIAARRTDQTEIFVLILPNGVGNRINGRPPPLPNASISNSCTI
jgi:hypothetical protein